MYQWCKARSLHVTLGTNMLSSLHWSLRKKEGISRGSLPSTPQSLNALDISLGWLILLLCLLSGLPLSLYDAGLSISHPWFARYNPVLAAALLFPSLQSPEGGHLPPWFSGLPGLWRDLSSWVLCSPGTSQTLNFPTESLRWVHTV